ncbi:hypothetical protein [Tessaracoccus caeni]|uniref:hypothetical protein n=1 Tax=Tessaracoccus caeni TaxID=3031239 RepID=UPI0023DCA079|nr:hypothetical protein [Tessaracoccus caeni]MDF1489887.1 hypothetical protein [Tessaracoccus caeni]
MCERVTSAWARVTPGLYLSTPPTFESAIWAASLYSGPNGVIGSSAAAYLAGALRDPPSEIVVWDHTRHQPIQVGRWATRYRRGARSGRGAPARLPVEQSLIDVARDSGLVDTMDAVSRALARRITTPERLLAELERHQRVRHSTHIRAMCSVGKAGIESALEWLFDESVIIAHQLPTPRRQAMSEEGRIDCHFDAFRVIAELDGMRDHCEWSKDMLRDNAHALRLDATTLRYGWHAVLRQPCLVASQLAEALVRRGWQGDPGRCRRCP